jgi:Aromatic-ring-opening dioxygenase LigAB, LigA subunit/Nif11 domain
MSREGVASFLVKVMEDEGFRNQLKSSPEATLAQFDLTPEEVAAIKSADPSKIQDLGVDERVSKTAAVDKLYMTDAVTLGSSAANVPWSQLPTLLKHLLNP